MRIPKGNKTNMDLSFQSLVYADDTMLYQEEENKMEALLWSIEDISEVFGLKLNRVKCQQISIMYKTGEYTSRQIKFKNGENVPRTSSATYLGSILNEKTDPRQEINKRICEVAYCRRKLSNLWKRASMNKRQKLLIHEALVASKLLYALEAIPIPDDEYDKIDASYMKGIRQILEMKTTYGQQMANEEMTNTNE